MKSIRSPFTRLFAALAAACAIAAVSRVLAQQDGDWEKFTDGSIGKVTEYRGVNDTPIAAYLRKPKGDGPFPVVVIVHGGGNSKEGTYALGRLTQSPTASFIAQGWAVYSIDFRPQAPFQPIEWEDARLAVEGLKKIPGLDGSRVAMFGNSHGGYNTARAVSRCDLRCAIPCAAAAIDPIEVAKAHKSGEAVNQRALDAIARQAEGYGLTLEQLITNPPTNYSTPLTEVDKVRCPILIISGRNDPASPPSVMETYAARLRGAGKEAELYLPDNGPHGFVFGRPRIPETEEATRRMVAFIAKHFGVPVRSASQKTKTTMSASRPAADERAVVLFRRLDTNTDGHVSGDEAASESGRRFVGQFDRNGDGSVTLGEIGGRSTPPAAATVPPSPAAAPATKGTAKGIESLEKFWADPDKTEPPGTTYRTFRSAIARSDVSYLLYLPPDYDTAREKRYPVLYWLHGTGGTQSRASEVIKRLGPAIGEGKAPPMIVVLVNGLRAATMYCDSRDGQWPLESVLMRELIPHIDATCRTIARREARAVEGFSMGGFGAAHLGFKYPEVFGVVSILGPALLGPDLKIRWEEHFSYVFKNDLAAYEAENPYRLAARNADLLRGRSIIRMVAHDGPDHWQIARCDQLHAVLQKNNIAHDYEPRRDVTKHNYVLLYDALGDRALGFYKQAFARVAADTNPRPVSTEALQTKQGKAKSAGASVIPGRMRTPIRELLAQGKVPWNDSRTDKAEGMLLKRHRSDIIKGDISYLIHLPPSYEKEAQRRFPVVYWLHGGGGTQRDCWKFLEEVKKGNADGSCPEMIVVGVNGIASSIYSDSKDGKLPFESVIIRELIPHIDRTYRTIADRSGRALEGFSMGGFGVYHLGFKFPEMFGVLTALGPALLEFDGGAANVEGALRNGPYEGDREYFKINEPFHLVEKNAEAIRGRTSIRLLDNEQTSSFTYRRTLEFIEHLKKLNIACDYRRLAGSGHNYERYYNEYPGSVAFYATAFKSR